MAVVKGREEAKYKHPDVVALVLVPLSLLSQRCINLKTNDKAEIARVWPCHNALIDAVAWPHIQVCCIYSIALYYETEQRNMSIHPALEYTSSSWALYKDYLSLCTRLKSWKLWVTYLSLCTRLKSWKSWVMLVWSLKGQHFLIITQVSSGLKKCMCPGSTNTSTFNVSVATVKSCVTVGHCSGFYTLTMDWFLALAHKP